MIEVLRRPVDSALHSLVAVMDQSRQVSLIARAGPDRVLEGVQGKVGAQ